MSRNLAYASLFLWTLVPVAIAGVYHAKGTPHLIWSYTFAPNGDPHNPFADRHYWTCTYWGLSGQHTVPATAGHCSWVRFFHEAV
ncbi:MAG: hypothetical protein AAF360_01570 [Pseudomonadota bacterium]